MAKEAEEIKTSSYDSQEEPDLFGSFRFKVDSKGRVALPSKFRKVLSNDLIVSRELKDECLYVFEPKSFNNWVSQLFEYKLGGYDPSKISHVRLRTRLKSNANDVEVDSSGRITLKPELREAVGIDKEVVIVGNTGYFEIWDAAAYDTSIEDLDLGVLYSE